MSVSNGGQNVGKKLTFDPSDALNKNLGGAKKITVTYTSDLFTVPGTFEARFISVNVAGDVNMKCLNDDGFDVVTLTAGTLHKIIVDQIDQSDTTATGIIIWG